MIVPEWETIKISAMAFTLSEKLRQHPVKFGNALAETRGRGIVEISYRDSWWGAKPNGRTLRGANVLGQLLTRLAELLDKHKRTGLDRRAGAEAAASEFVSEFDTSRLMIMGQPADARVPA